MRLRTLSSSFHPTSGFREAERAAILYVWVREHSAHRIDQMMNFAWKFMCRWRSRALSQLLYALCRPRVAGWLWSLAGDSNCLQCLVDFARYEKKFAPRVYRSLNEQRRVYRHRHIHARRGACRCDPCEN